ncbi:MAG TPA: hypothetical protein VGS22_23050 [Thermoanaerobaculia bacterium]|jgi:hypothetical protein|nr:hypothetical protein [Thermoanaerobaculia bacterium]
MTTGNYLRVSGLVFAFVALAHAYRAIRALPILIGTTSFPIWTSWLAVVVSGALSVWAFRSRA